MKQTFERRLASGLLLALAALCVAGLVSYRSTREFADAGKAVARSQEVLQELHAILSSVKEAETRHLAFFATRFEAPSAAKEPSGIGLRFDRLKKLAGGDHERLQSVRRLERHVWSELDMLQRLRDSRKKGAAREVGETVDWHSVSALAERSEVTAAAIAASENATLQRLTEAVRIKARRSSHAFLALAALTALIIGIAFYRLSSNMQDRRRTMERLRHSEERYRLLAENSLDLISLLDHHGSLIYASPSHETVLGYDPARLVGQGLPVLIHPEDLSLVRLAIGRLPEKGPGKPIDVRFCRASGEWVDVELLLSTFSIRGFFGGRVLLSARSIAERKRAQQEREKLIQELQEAFAKIKVLSGFLPICASCKKIRDDQGYWNQLEAYIQSHTGAQFSHGICPDCAAALYPEHFTKGA